MLKNTGHEVDGVTRQDPESPEYQGEGSCCHFLSSGQGSGGLSRAPSGMVSEWGDTGGGDAGWGLQKKPPKIRE